MASIQGVKVTGVIVPSDTLDTYAVIDPIYGIDGLRNLAGDTSDLNLITTDRRRAGMLVGINYGASYYKLNPAPWNNTLSDWTPFAIDNLQKTITSSYTVTSADNNYTIIINNNTTAITITIPSGLSDKINIGFIQQGSADVTFVAGANVTINSPASMLKIKGQNYWAYLEQVTNSNIYQLVGSLKL